MDAYWIEKECWQLERNHLLEPAGLTEFSDLDLVHWISCYPYSIRHNDCSAANGHLKLCKNVAFYIVIPVFNASEANPPGTLFPQRHDMLLAQVLETGKNHCGLLSSFEHWQQTNVR